MDKKRKLVDYLISVMAQMDKERGKRMNYAAFAKLCDLPHKTTASMFDPDYPRLPSKSNAAKVAIALGSNEINRILGYPDVDPKDISFFRTYRQLDEDQQSAILEKMHSLADPKKTQALAL